MSLISDGLKLNGKLWLKFFSVLPTFLLFWSIYDREYVEIYLNCLNNSLKLPKFKIIFLSIRNEIDF